MSETKAPTKSARPTRNGRRSSPRPVPRDAPPRHRARLHRPYLDEKRTGTYACVCCGAPLFRSETKYESGSGWPSFFSPAEDGAIAERTDTSFGMVRTEILCARCDAHVGHVFPDGPRPTGLRYCTNGVALKLEPDDQ